MRIATHRHITEKTLKKIMQVMPMNTFRILIASLLMVLFGTVSASPMYYTFTGKVSQSFGSSNIAANTDVVYVFLLDFMVNGSVTRNDGAVVTLGDHTSSNAQLSHFYADYISGSLLDPIDGGSNNNDADAAEINFGQQVDFFDNTTGVDSTSIQGGSANDPIKIQTNSLFSDWFIGLAFAGDERAYSSTGLSGIVGFNLNLTAISVEAPPLPSAIPVPAAIWLFGTALFGLLGLSKRKSWVAV